MTQPARNVRKAAILLASLDAAQADELLRQLSPAQADALRREVEALGNIALDERGDVIQEFVRVGPLLPARNPAGIELNAPLPASMGPCAQVREHRAFHFLHEAPVAKVVPLLEREHPQTIAVVVSHVPAARAAEILAQLAGELQADVARRLVALEQADPEVLREVERGLQSSLCTPPDEPVGESAGITALCEILAAADPASRDRILSSLSRHDRRLAEQLEPPAPPPLVFADLLNMDPVSLSVVVHHADDELLRLALADVAPEFVERVLGLLGSPAAEVLRGSLCNLGPTRLADVEQAQRHLAALAEHLVRRGDIAPDVRSRLSIAV